MQDSQNIFLSFALKKSVLQFGKFTLNSGRISPYFFNTSFFNTGESLNYLGNFYARTIIKSQIKFNILYGPAYKGIPLASVTSMALFNKYKKDTAYASNRKEVKDHGEKGFILGHSLEGKVLIIDDVISSGTSVGKSINIIQQAKAKPIGVIIAFDRQERSNGNKSTIQEIEENYKIPTYSLVSLEHLIKFIRHSPKYAKWLNPICVYKERYGIY